MSAAKIREFNDRIGVLELGIKQIFDQLRDINKKGSSDNDETCRRILNNLVEINDNFKDIEEKFRISDSTIKAKVCDNTNKVLNLLIRGNKYIILLFGLNFVCILWLILKDLLSF